MNLESEQYIYLGYINKHFFFSHVIYNKEKFNPETSYQIYNILINNQMIDSKEQCVIIYDLNKENDLSNVVSIKHNDSKKNTIFDKETLSNIYKELITSKKEQYLVFSFNYDIGAFYTYTGDIPDLLSGTDANIDGEKLNIGDITYTITTKEITYL